MKKMKFLMLLGSFLFAFMVLGLQNAQAQVQYQPSQDAFEMLKLEVENLTPVSMAPAGASDAEVSDLNYRVTKMFMTSTLKALDQGTNTATAVDTVYNNLLGQAGGDADRINLIDEAKHYVDDLLEM